ncbi:MAG TPA: hypothetical protein VG737_17025, partial [Cyclobacteriaceae bacterium]|nr:hypothetical protein [Cyclobacteriaceae bacterium]
AILGALLEDKGQIDGAIKYAKKARSLSNNKNDKLVVYLLQNNQIAEAIQANNGANGLRSDANEVMIQAKIDLAKAKTIFNQFIKKYGESDTYDCATVSMSVGDTNAALTYLEKAYDNGYIVWLRTDRTFNPLHTNPRFIALIKKLNFPP